MYEKLIFEEIYVSYCGNYRIRERISVFHEEIQELGTKFQKFKGAKIILCMMKELISKNRIYHKLDRFAALTFFIR